MAVREILKMGDPRLLRVAQRCESALPTGAGRAAHGANQPGYHTNGARNR